MAKCITLQFVHSRRWMRGGWSMPCHSRFTPIEEP